MILIADGGATKTSWCFSGKGDTPGMMSTGGINPYFRTTEDIIQELQKSSFSQLSGKVEQVFFYGSGVVDARKAQVISEALFSFFPTAEIEVQSDLLAAARATLGKKEGITCILGTGSNSCQYDGEKITAHIPPLGFILGDEGSGAGLGKQLVSDYLKKIMPSELLAQFQARYPLEYTEFLNRVYNQGKPNQFLAGFVPFLKENIHKSYCAGLVRRAFESFMTRNVVQYKGHEKQSICFVGSVAFHFQEQLRNVLLERNMVPGVILQEPLLKLMEYHLQLKKYEQYY
ncbi:ATPase [Mariniphaga sediminis]|uniref:ATPase n=1 Tax=Mariniphaga sediminis TaxID=1628158 RepID=A0A399D6R2_9BACT|nr:ATPase [Mariniphaga sediminis]RIH66858.1 ATPase [Mariniphaga sediminis]